MRGPCWRFGLSGRSAAADRELRKAGYGPQTPGCGNRALGRPLPQPPHYAPVALEEACVAAEELRPAFLATPGAIDWIAAVHDQREQELDRLRGEKRRKEWARQKKRKSR